MLHLAQVKQTELEGKVRLKLLAQQKAEYAWALLPSEESDLLIDIDAFPFNEGALVLVELSAHRQIKQIADATPWLMDFVEQYLAIGITPALLQEEMQRAEQWRQSLTLQSQELGRRALEMEARRDQIQELEENLKEEKKQLEAMASQLKEIGNKEIGNYEFEQLKTQVNHELPKSKLNEAEGN